MNRCLRFSIQSISLVVIAMLLLSLVNVAPAGAVPPQSVPAGKAGQGAGAAPAAKLGLPATFGNLPLYFVENRGQMDDRVTYYVQGAETTLYFTAQGVTFALTDTRQKAVAASLPAEVADGVPPRVADLQRWVVKQDFLNTRGVRPVAHDQAEAVISYFKGARDQWKTGLPTYSTLVYADLWPGIDLIYSGSANRLKYQFQVRPGADPKQIRLSYRGATAVALNSAGQLAVSTPGGGFTDDVPMAYQESAGGQRKAVSMAYALGGGCSDSGRRPAAGYAGQCAYGFEVGAYDLSQTLVLDPAVVVYAGYIGGSGTDYGNDIAVDNSGNAYITGYTTSAATSFPVNAGPDLTYNGNGDAFVAKVNYQGTALVYAGYLGGTGVDEGYSLTMAGSAVYVTGETTSTDFPVTGDLHNTNAGSYDAFVAGIDSTGTTLHFSGYLGGASADGGLSIAYASPGCSPFPCIPTAAYVYVTGFTTSTDFPVLSTKLDTTYNGGNDAFVARVNLRTSKLDYAGYIGGSGDDQGWGIAAGFGGPLITTELVFVTGNTNSTEATFPVKGTTLGPTFNGGTDAFVAILSDGSLANAGYVGGTGNDYGRDVAVRCVSFDPRYQRCSDVDAYLTGDTNSPGNLFPVLGSRGLRDAFVADIHSSGALIYGAYIAGTGNEFAYGIAVDTSGNAYVAGYTSSTEASSFPVTAGPDLTYNGGSYDAFVAKVNASGSTLLYAGYLGGLDTDYGRGVAVDSSGNASVVGYTASTEARSFPVTAGPALTYNGGSYDAFVAKVPAGAVPKLGFGASSYSVSEGVGQAAISVNLTASSWTTVTVHYATSNGTAQAPGDYTAASGTLTFVPGTTTRTFNVGIIDDILSEPNETLTLTLSSPVNASLGYYSAVPLTIGDNDMHNFVYLPGVWSPWPCPVAETEPNDDYTHANPVCSNVLVSGSFIPPVNNLYCDGCDYDYFSITVPQPGTIRAVLSNGDENSQIEIRDTSGGQISLDDCPTCWYSAVQGSGSAGGAVTYPNVAPGTYYVRILNTETLTHNYNLWVTLP
jgi:hypothetical protein